MSIGINGKECETNENKCELILYYLCARNKNRNHIFLTKMKKNKDFPRPGWRRLGAAIALSVCLTGFTACDKYDLDQNDPAGWGASIYSYLAEDGNFTNTVRLIDDLGMREVLSKTGSKTLFVADDDAFARFYASNKWGVHDYSQLSMSQKKLLLNSSMVNSSYQVSDLSSLEGPKEGLCMRRLSSQTVYDSVAVVKEADLPNMTPEAWRWNKTWKKFQGRGQVVLMRDMSIPPMVHFIEEMMVNNKITNDDYNFLYNNETDRQPGDASVNGVTMQQQNIKCSNGFIHRMADVIMPLDNMADIVASKPQTSIYSKLLERFSAPYYAGKDVTDQYNYLYGTQVDSVFQKRFFSSKSQGGTALVRDDDNQTHNDELLSYDPGWNTYFNGLAIPSINEALQKNMGVMLVPTDAAMNEYWENGPGKVLKDQYGSWDNVPNNVIVELMNNNLLEDFVGSVPSKFDAILNDANDPMGVSKENIDSVWLGCNGAVYLTNKVFSPTTFVSVLYPAVVNENMRIINWAVKKCQYNVYLNSLNSYYSFFIPDNESLLSYIDPASFGKAKQELYRFHYDERRQTVWASRWEYDMETEEIGDSIAEVRDEYSLREKLKDVLDNHVVVGNVEDGNTYYRTKGGQEIMVKNAAMGANGMTVSGSMQINETNRPLRVKMIYDQTIQGNGKCYVLEDEPIQTTRKSVLDMMRERPEMSEMVKLLEGSSLHETIHDQKHACVSENISVFNTFHYTVYVPTNETILELQRNGQLPTWDQVHEAEEAGNQEKKTSDSLAIENFLRYHIQDMALFIGAQPQAEEGYETSLIGKTGKFERVYAKLTGSDLEVRTSQTDTHPRKVIKTPGLYNIMAREYQLDGTDRLEATNVYTSSTAVIHLIDGALIKK